MTASRRAIANRTDKFNKNIHKRGNVPDGSMKPKSNYAVGPVLLGFFIFVVIGSSLLQIIRTATSGGPPVA